MTEQDFIDKYEELYTDIVANAKKENVDSYWDKLDKIRSDSFKLGHPTYKLTNADDKIYFYLCKVDNFNPSEVASADWER